MTTQPSIEVRIIEGNIHPAVLVDMHAETFLPDTLDATTRCDSCGAQALHAFALQNVLPGTPPNVLLACNHHGRTWARMGMLYLAHRDYRTPLAKWNAAQKVARDAAEKAVAAKTLDDSNLTQQPLWQAQWDLPYWPAN